MSISEEEVIRIYGKRWNIEVFSKYANHTSGSAKSLALTN